MLPFNTYSIFDLLSVMVAAPLAISFYIRYYLNRSQRQPALLFANMLVLMVVICTFMFLQDNLVPAGALARSVPDAANRMITLCRGMFVCLPLMIAASMHFSLRYTGSRGPLSRNVKWLYITAICWAPAIWSPYFFTAQREPLAERGSWSCTVPYWPNMGPLAMLFMGIWIVTMSYNLYLQWTEKRVEHRESAHSGVEHHETPLSHKLIRFGLAIWIAAGTFDIVSGFFGYTGISTTSPAQALAAILYTVALISEQLAADKHRHKTDHEMDLAKGVQDALIPKALPDCPGTDCAAWTQSASKTGGDTYDIWMMPDGRLGIFLADASGHGLAAAMIVSQARAMVRALANVLNPNPEKILGAINSRLNADLDSGRFVTAFLAFLSPDGYLDWFSAGHGPVLLRRSIGSDLEIMMPPAAPLGVLGEKQWEVDDYCQYELAPGGALIICSDGIFESFDPAGHEFGASRVREIIEQAKHEPAAVLLTKLQEAVLHWQNGRQPNDDQTIVLIQRPFEIERNKLRKTA